MSMPFALATCQMVSPGRADTTFPSSVNSSWSVMFLSLGASGHLGSQALV